jgi:hyperosmotically inducible protein
MFMFRFLVKAVVAVVVLIVVAGVAAYALGYWQGGGAMTVPASDVAGSRETAREVGAKVAEKTHDISVRARDVVADGALTAKIKSKMALDDAVKALAIDVDTVDGVVRLTGTVGSPQERDKALALARDTVGVKEVRDGLLVRTP